MPCGGQARGGPNPGGMRGRPNTLFVHALRLHSAGGEELDVVRREGAAALLFSQNIP